MLLFFFKQKTADEMRSSDWSSDVCSSDLVRYGQLANLRRRGQNLVFDFVPDAEHAYLSQADLFGRSDELGINPFEQHRTHWAIKEGDLPQNLIATGTAELQDRTIQIIANEYRSEERRGGKKGVSTW